MIYFATFQRTPIGKEVTNLQPFEKIHEKFTGTQKSSRFSRDELPGISELVPTSFVVNQLLNFESMSPPWCFSIGEIDAKASSAWDLSKNPRLSIFDERILRIGNRQIGCPEIMGKSKVTPPPPNHPPHIFPFILLRSRGGAT